jgi:tRNA A-37 threonylcarbamoyl transferase component Bud32
MSDLTGTTLGPYTIVEKIGGGGMATVYKAYQPAVDRYVALKVVRADMADTPQFRQRFDREARTIARLEHRYILPVYDFGEANGIPYLVMRYTNGGTLDALIAAGGLSQARAIKFIAQIAEALAYAHSQNVIHRDIKPANVLLSSDDNVLLTDFGIAKLMAGTTALTGTGAMVGTPFYMAPEQVRSQPVDARTDIYALGIVLYECLTGQRPFTGDTPLAVMYMQVRDPLPLPHTINQTVGENLERIVLKATAKEPADRFQNAAELAAALNALRAAPPDLAPAPPPALATPPAPAAAPPQPAVQPARPRRVPLWGWAVGGGLIAAALLLGFYLLNTPASVAGTPTVGAAAASATQAAPQPSAQPAAAAPTVPAAAPPSVEPASPAALRSYNFDAGSADGWTGDQQEWRVVQDGQNQFVYEGQAPPAAFTSASPSGDDTAAVIAQPNYVLELRLRVIAAGDPSDDFADVWIAVRASSDQNATNGCESYQFLLDMSSDEVTLARNGQELCGGFTVLRQNSYALELNRWYTLRAMVNGAQISLTIDGQTVVAATDTQLAQGFVYVTLGQGVKAQFDAIQLIPLP